MGHWLNAAIALTGAAMVHAIRFARGCLARAAHSCAAVLPGPAPASRAGRLHAALRARCPGSPSRPAATPALSDANQHDARQTAPHGAALPRHLGLGRPPGTAGCRADYLLDFLKHNESERLYTVGDIIDGWQLRRGWYWPQSHNDVVQKLLRKARKGTEVIYVPGNHDEMARQFDGLAFGDITVREDAVHVTATGRHLWVVHGDLFDGVVQHARWLAYGRLAVHRDPALNRHFNRVRARLGYWSLSQYLKHRVKNAVNYINSFEHAMVEEARRRGCDGVICGHIHKAEIREVDGQLYCNDGDWVESLSALVETMEAS